MDDTNPIFSHCYAVESLPENTSINVYWGLMLMAKCTHFPHTITWEKFAAMVEECTHKKTWKVTLCWRIKSSMLCWCILQQVSNEHNSLHLTCVTSAPITFLPRRKTAVKTVLQYTTMRISQLMFHTCSFSCNVSLKPFFAWSMTARMYEKTRRICHTCTVVVSDKFCSLTHWMNGLLLL